MSAQQSLDRFRATETCWDAVVIGAGPAGSMAARELARRGIRVLLIERKPFPRAKVCGACLNQRAVSWLEAAGLADLLPRLGAITTRRFLAFCDRRTVELALPGGVAVSRESLDGALIQAAIDSGAEFLPGVAAQLRASRDDCAEREIELTGPTGAFRIISAKVVLAADGLGRPALRQSREFAARTSPRAKIGVRARIMNGPARFQPGTIYMAVGSSGYTGLVRLEDGSLNLAAAIEPRALRHAGSPAAAVTAILEQAGMPAIELPSVGSWKGTPPLTQHAVRPASRRVFLLGDAAAYVEPFTGEGIAWALGSGMAVAPLVERGLQEWNCNVEDAWLRTHQQLVRDRQFWCRGFAALLRRPRLARLAVRLASAWPMLCQPIVRSLNQPALSWETSRS